MESTVRLFAEGRIAHEMLAGAPHKRGKIVLSINTDRVQSPKDIGINDDSRRLGVAVERVLIRESNPVDH